ncbi:MAG: hypothetical protein VX815_13005 [Gemmatimonadota bacterium]|nr:hypothetical protein [Gemmatimonadota bacterium]
MTESQAKPPRPRLPSLLSAGLKRFLVVAIGVAGLLLADTVYLVLVRLADRVGLAPFALGADTLPRFYQFLVLAHTAVGILLVSVMVVFLVAHLPKVWRRFHAASAWSGIAYAVLGVTLLVTGLFILSAAATRENQWAWWTHVIASSVVVGAYVVHRVVSFTRPNALAFARYLGAVSAGALALFLTHGALVLAGGGAVRAQRSAGAGGPDRDIQELLAGRFGPSGWVPVAAVPPASPFFPSATTTTTGEYLAARILTTPGFGTPRDLVRAEVAERGFVQEARIGAESCETCHPDVVDQWAASAHRFASFNNPFYEATIMDMRRGALESNPWIEEHAASFPDDIDGVGRAKSKWCSGCHDPALMLAGTMGREIDRGSLEAQAGLTCLACHAIDRIHDQTGNGNYNIANEQEDPYLFPSSTPGSAGRYLHDLAVKARPAVHKARLLKPFHTESVFCATCHKVSLTEPVNNYRWLRGQDDFDNWDDSGVALNASRTFYLPPSKRVCQDCHMPFEPAPRGDVAADNGMVRSHRFLAVNTALAYVRGDTATVRRIEEFLSDQKLTVDVLAVKASGRAATMPLGWGASAVEAGVPLTFDVVVRNAGVGHTFPGGTNDSNEGWLEFTIEDGEGNLLVASGEIGEDGHLDPMAHTFKAVIVDRDGQAIHRRNAQDIHVAVYQNVIGPGTADIAHYEVVLPEEWVGSRLTVRARLLWRKFDRAYTEFAFAGNPAGFARFDDVPDLPITEIASDSARVIVVDGVASGGPGSSPRLATEWVRYNDYGIGLLLEGDTRGAATAFSIVEALRPDISDGPLNLAKTALAAGDLADAYAGLERAEEISTGDARAAWVWGRVLQEDGRYEESVLAYQRVLEVFPEDRATWRAMGRTLFLDQQFERALESLAEVLRIDPEDRVAHYHRMLSLRALGRDDEADLAEAAYLYYAIDESAQAITRAYRARDAGANIMAQPIPTHRLEIRR